MCKVTSHITQAKEIGNTDGPSSSYDSPISLDPPVGAGMGSSWARHDRNLQESERLQWRASAQRRFPCDPEHTNSDGVKLSKQRDQQTKVIVTAMSIIAT